MADYINRKELIENLNKFAPEHYSALVNMLIEKQPAADVVAIKHGYNASQMNPVDEFTCSECGFTCTDYSQVKYDEDGDYTYYCECEFKYCPHCGAKMDGRSNSDGRNY